MAQREPVASVAIKPSRIGKIRNGYPWVKREEVVGVVGRAEPGDVVAILGPDGPVGIGFYNPVSRFPVRVLEIGNTKGIDEAWFADRFARAKDRRQSDPPQSRPSPLAGGRAYGGASHRVVFAEADGLPGLIVDRYSDWLIGQVRSMGMHRCRDIWLPALLKSENPKGILERSDMESLAEEGLETLVEVLFGEFPDEIEVEEHGIKFIVPTRGGLKTGFYLDQCEARRRLLESTKPGERVLDICCYSGGFSLHAAKVGAVATGVDILPEAIELARRNAALNNLSATFIEANAFDWLADNAEEYDTIILDPPAIAKTAGERDSLRGAIHKLCELAIPRLKSGGRLVVFSCSYQLGIEALIEAVRQAANDCHTSMIVEHVTLQPPDHPYLAQFPESLYLKGVWARIERLSTTPR